MDLKKLITEGYEEYQTKGQEVNPDEISTFEDYSVDSFTTFRERQLLEAEEEKAKRDKPGFWDVLPVAREREWGIESFKRDKEREKQGEYDPDFKIPKEEYVRLDRSYSKEEVSFLQKSFSQEDYNSRLQDIEDDRKRKRYVDSAGLSGVAASMAMALLDPSVIPLTLVTGGLSTAAKASRVVNILRAGGVSAFENAAIESYLMKGDTQRTPHDVMVAAFMGMGIGGAIGALTRVKAKGTPRETTIANLNEMDDANRELGYEMTIEQAGDTYLQHKGIDSFSVSNHDLAEIETIRINNKASQIPLGEKQLTRIKGRQGELKSLIKDVRAQKGREIASYWAKTGVTRGFKRHIDNVRASEINRKYDFQIESLTKKLESDQDKLFRHSDILRARKEKGKWDSLTPEDKMKQLEYDGISKNNRSVQIAVQKSAYKLENIATMNFETKYKEEVKVPEGGSVGAARVQTKEEIYASTNIEADENWMADRISLTYDFSLLHGRNWRAPKSNLLFTDFTNLDQSSSIQVRALNHALNENPQRAALGHSAAVLVLTNTHILKKANRNAIDEGFNRYITENNLGKIKGHVNPEYRENFNTAVTLSIKNNTQDIPESIKIARDGVRNGFKEALELRKAHGELGFEDVKSDITYVPDLIETSKVNNLIFNKGWSKEDVVELISKGYQQGGVKLGVKQAKAVATATFERIANATIRDGDSAAIYRANSASDTSKLFKEANVPQDIIDDFFAEALSKDSWANVSNRARSSLKISWNAEHKGIKISDIMNTNAANLSESFLRESAFGAAMAEIGIKSEGQLTRIMEQAKVSALNNVKAFGDEAVEINKIKTDFDRLQMNITQLKGQSLLDPANRFTKSGRMVMDLTGISSLQQAVFASVPDTARTFTSTGISEVIRAVPGSDSLRMPWRRRDPTTMKAFSADMEELEQVLGFIGEDDFMNTLTVRSEEFGGEESSRFFKKVDNVIEGVSNIGKWMTGYNLINGGSAKITARAISKKLLDDSLGKEKLGKALTYQLELAGMSKERWAEIGEWRKNNSSKGMVNGKSIDIWGFNKMPPKMKRDMQVLFNRVISRHNQKAMTGEMNSAWLGSTGRFLTQFKIFSLVSLEKQLIPDARGPASVAASVFMWNTGLAYAAHMAQINLNALGMSDADAEEYLRKNTEGKALALAVLNKHSQLAFIGILEDSGIFLGVLPSEMFDSSRYGYQKGRIESLAPALGYGAKVASLSGSTANLVFDRLRDDVTLEDSGKAWVKDLKRIAPVVNSVILSEYIKNIADLNEDK